MGPKGNNRGLSGPGASRPSSPAAPGAVASRFFCYNHRVIAEKRAAHPAYLLDLCPAEEAESLAADSSVGSWLSAAEILLLERIKLPKRRRDWLAGRKAAKRALAAYLAQTAAPPEPSLIEIFNEPSGRPFCRLPAGAGPAFSLSHTDSGAACAVKRGGGSIGLDWEQIAPRDPRVIVLAFHPEERTPALEVRAAEQTKIWALKEAVLKYLGIGLAYGLHEVRFPGGEQTPELRGHARRLWLEFGSPPIRCESIARADSVLGLAY